jgi:general secretion pathway protein J
MNGRTCGFTLLEVLVAISIFAIIGLGANQMLRSVIDTQSRVRVVNETVDDISRALTVIHRDVTQVIPRGIRDEYGEPIGPLLVGQDNYVLELTRTGWNNPARHQRSEVQRVAYGIEDETLYRYFWLVLDRAEDSEPRSQVLLESIQGFSANVVGAEGETTDVWPGLDSNQVLPRGLEIIMNVKSVGEIRRIYAMPDPPQPLRGRSGGERDQESVQDQDSQVGVPVGYPLDARGRP